MDDILKIVPFIEELEEFGKLYRQCYPQVIQFWDWNFRFYLKKKKFSPGKKKKIGKWSPILKLLQEKSVKGIFNLSCGNIREFLQFLEMFVPSRLLQRKLLLNVDVVPATIEHANVYLKNRGFRKIEIFSSHMIWEHPKIKDFKILNCTGDANAILKLLESPSLVESSLDWALVWLDGISNLLPPCAKINSFDRLEESPYHHLFLKIFPFFSWSHVTWLYLSPDGKSMVVKLKFYRDVLWKASPSLFHRCFLVEGSWKGTTRDSAFIIESFSFRELNERKLHKIEHELKKKKPLHSISVVVEDENGKLSYLGYFVTPSHLASALAQLRSKVSWRIDEKVHPTPQVTINSRHFVKNFYISVINQSS